MTDFHAFDPARLFVGEDPYLFLLEILFRVLVIYLVAVIAMRFMGNAGKREMTPFDYLIVFTLGAVVGETMILPDISLLESVVAVAGMTLLTVALNKLQFRLKRSADLINGRARLIVKDGRKVDDALAKESISDEHLFSALRVAGASDISEVDSAFSELSGNVSVFLKKDMAGRGRGLLEEEHIDKA